MRTYLDANVFLYSFLDQDAGKKLKAVEIIAKAVESISGGDIKTITRYYADPAQPNLGDIRVSELL